VLWVTTSIIRKMTSSGIAISAARPKSNRLDRNWTSLFQELRVVQTGVQLLTGFLLTLPFQQRFDVLDEPMRIAYLVTVGCSVGATVLLVAPVGIHQLLFRRHRLKVLVSAAHRCAYAGLALLGTALTGVTVIVFDSVAGRAAGLTAGACALGLFGFLLVGLTAVAAHPRYVAPRCGWIPGARGDPADR
jgi:Family of unknown function (DUF6328)